MYDYASGSRCKPWENRELDLLDGIKVISFMMTSISITSYMLLYTNVIDIWELNSMVMTRERFISNMAFSIDVALEGFFLVSSFLGFYKCFVIQDAKNGILSIKDILKLYIRKFIRLAPAYYLMWILMWGINSRLGAGNIYYRTNSNMSTCSERWTHTFLWINNLNVHQMNPFVGCYQQAWPL